MKSKRLIIILSVLIFLTVLIVINSTLFTLQSVSINWLTSKYQLQNVKDYDIIDDIKLGQSIFLVKKNEISAKLEKSYPYLRVVSIETKFPNKLIVHSAERESLYAVKLSDREFAVLDEKGKVLALNNGSIFEGSEADLGTRPIQLNFHSLSIRVEDFVVGENVKSSYISELLTSLSRSFRESSYSPTTSKGVVRSIDIVSQGETSEISIKTRNGMVLTINEVEQYTTDKLLLAFERYNALHSQGIVDCTIKVWYCDNTSSIIADVVW
jgi:hypothetical protein